MKREDREEIIRDVAGYLGTSKEDVLRRFGGMAVAMAQRTRERPGCRKAILSRGLRPHVGPDGRWDGRHAVTPEGRRTALSGGLRKEMRLMIAEGRWPVVEA